MVCAHEMFADYIDLYNYYYYTDKSILKFELWLQY